MASWGKCDFKDFEKLRKQLEKAEKDCDDFCQACAKELAARLLAKVIKRTPVGKAPKLGVKTIKVEGASGKTKSFLTREGTVLQKYWAGYVGGTLRRGWTIEEIQKIGDTYQIEIINPVEYAPYVEYGHRQKPGRYVPALGKKLKKGWVPGKFMLTISIQQLQDAAPKILEKKLENWLRGYLDA